MATRTVSTKLAIEGESAYRSSLQKINSEIKTLQSSLKLTESQFKTNANSMAALTAKGDALSNLYNAQKSKVNELKSALENARKAEEKYAAQKAALTAKIEENNKKLEELKATADDTSDEERQLTEENRELAGQLEKCNANLDASTKGVNSWQTQLNNAEIKLNDLDSELRLNSEYLDEARSSSDKCATSIDRFGDRVKESADKADRLADALATTGVIAALKETAKAMAACAEASIGFESAMAGVAKTTDMSVEELDTMGNEIEKLSTQIPVAANEIAGIVEVAGQLGIAKEDLLGFSTVMANLGVATNMTSEEAATMLARFANVTKMAPDLYENLGSVIVALGNNFATTESEIVTMGQRLAAAGELAGLTEPEIMALATAMSSVGIQAEAGGTAMTQTLTAMEAAVSTGGESLEKFAYVAGMSAQEFSSTWQSSPILAIEAFIEGLGRLDAQGESATLMLEDMGLSGVRQSNMLKSLATASGLLSNAVSLANSAWAENTALMVEANTRYQTTESKLIMFRNSATSVEVAVGDKLTPAIGKLADAGTDMLGWLRDAIKESDTLVPTITALVVAIGTFVGSLTTVAATTKIASAAMSLFSGTLAVNPFFLAATAIGAVAAGIATLSLTLDNDAVPSVKDLTTAATNLEDAFGEANGVFTETKDGILAASDMAQSYISRLKELEEQGLTTNEAQMEYRLIVDKLNAILPDLNARIDEQTHMLIGGADALSDQVDAWKELAIQEALATKYQAEIKAWADAELEVYENQIKLNQAISEGEEISSKITETQRRMAEIYDEQNAIMQDTTMSAVDQQMAFSALDTEWLACSDTLTELYAQQNDNKATQDAYTDAIEQGTAIAAEYEGQVNDAKAAMEGFAESTEEASASTDGLSTAFAEQEETIKQVKADIDELATKFKEAYDACRDSLDGQVGLFGNYAASIAEETDTAAEMLDIWAQQTANLASYTENLKRAAAYGLDEGLVQSLADGSTESAGYLATILSEIDNCGTGLSSFAGSAEEAVAKFNESFSKTEDAKDKLALTMTAINEELGTKLAELEQTAAEVNFDGFWEAVDLAFAECDIEFSEIGTNLGIGLAEGISGSTADVQSAATTLADDTTTAAKTSFGVNSPSTVWREIGTNLDVGLAEGIRDQSSSVMTQVTKLATDVSTRMRTAGNDSKTSFVQSLMPIVSESGSIMSQLSSAIMSSTSALPGYMQSIGAGVVDGMISGMYGRSGALYSAINSIVSSAISSARSSAGVRSPSTKTKEIFEYVGEGMIVGIQAKKSKVAEATQDVVNSALSLDTSSIKLMSQTIRDSIPDISTLLPERRISSGTTINEGNVDVHIAELVVREEADVNKVAQQIADEIRRERRKRGQA